MKNVFCIEDLVSLKHFCQRFFMLKCFFYCPLLFLQDVPTIASSSRPVIDSYKNNNNIPLPTRQSGLDRLYNAFAKKVPPDLASELVSCISSL